jgi:hypothetical protein
MFVKFSYDIHNLLLLLQLRWSPHRSGLFGPPGVSNLNERIAPHVQRFSGSGATNLIRAAAGAENLC